MKWLYVGLTALAVPAVALATAMTCPCGGGCC